MPLDLTSTMASSMRVELDALPRDDWQHFLRARDLEQVLAATPEPLRGPVLEIGCGDGYLTSILAHRFEQVVPIDIRPRAHAPGLCIANAEALPFRDDCFGLIFSSNVLEHIGDLSGCLGELRRVMRDDGIMIHTMPTPTWKALQFFLFPLHMLFQVVLPKVSRGLRARSGDGERRSISGGPIEAPKRRSPLQRAFWPQVHGTAGSHFEEIRRFRSRWWVDQFSSKGLRTLKTAPLYLHSAYRLMPYRALKLRERLSRGGLCSVRAYWVSKAT